MNTTIALSKELKEKISKLGNAGDTYEDVLEKMYESARRNLIRDWLYDESNSITIAEARKEIGRR